MAAIPQHKMTVDEFLVWSEATPGRYELWDGIIQVMRSERAKHARIKGAIFGRLTDALKGASLPCEAFPDGMTVRIDSQTAYEPDAVVNCGARLDGDAVEIPRPVVVVEVLFPSTAATDRGEKLADYFRLPSVQHYILINPVRMPVIHHARQDSGKILTSLVSAGSIDLTPPGIRLSVDNLLELSGT